MTTISDPAAPLAVGAGCATLLPKPPPVPAVVVISGAKENDEAGKAGGWGLVGAGLGQLGSLGCAPITGLKPLQAPGASR